MRGTDALAPADRQDFLRSVCSAMARMCPGTKEGRKGRQQVDWMVEQLRALVDPPQGAKAFRLPAATDPRDQEGDEAGTEAGSGASSLDVALATATSFDLASLCCQSGLNAGDAQPCRDPALAESLAEAPPSPRPRRGRRRRGAKVGRGSVAATTTAPRSVLLRCQSAPPGHHSSRPPRRISLLVVCRCRIEY